MNNKGFTLIELLAVIILLGIILGIVVPSVTRAIGDSKQKAYDTTIESVKTATESYMNMDIDGVIKQNITNNGSVNITIAELIATGFLPKDVTNPLTGEDLGGSVTITRVSENKYNYQYNE